MAEGKLYVIFRGNWAFLETPNMVFVKTPDMGDDHLYQAGNFSDLYDIRRGSFLRLSGASGGIGRVDDRLHPVIKKTQMGAPEECTSVTTIVLPQPSNIFSLNGIPVRSDKFTTGKKHMVSQTGNGYVICSLTHVLEYSFADRRVLRLEGLQRWIPNPRTGPDGATQVATLHFRAEPAPDTPVPAGHPAMEFRFASLLLDDDLEIDMSDPTAFGQVVRGTPPMLISDRPAELDLPVKRRSRVPKSQRRRNRGR